MSQRPKGGSLQTVATEAAPAQSRHLCGDRRLVDEHQAARLKPHQGPALVDPYTPFTNVGALALRRHELLF
jgi:hypothetical protein